MLPKPSACQGCPLYGDGKGFVPDERYDAPVTILAQNPGADEERGQRVTGYSGRVALYEPNQRGPAPLIGKTGYDMERTYFPIAKLERGKVSICNVLKCRVQIPRRTNDLPTGKVLDAALDHCTSAHLRIPPSTRLVVAMGALAWRAMGGPGTITDWRGYLKPGEDK